MKLTYNHIFLSICWLIATIAVGLLYAYMHFTVGNSANRALVAESIVRAQEVSNAQQKTMAQIYEDTVNDRARLTSFFVSDDAAVAFIESLESLGPQTGSTVALTNVAADDTSTLASGSLAHIKAHIDATGPWPSIMRALMLSEVLPYQSALDNIRLDSSVGDKNKVTWRLSYDIAAGMIAHARSSAH